MVFMADFLLRRTKQSALAQLFAIVRHEQLVKCCIDLAYKKYDLKTIEGVASGRAKKTVQAVKHERRGFFDLGNRQCFLGSCPDHLTLIILMVS